MQGTEFFLSPEKPDKIQKQLRFRISPDSLEYKKEQGMWEVQ